MGLSLSALGKQEQDIPVTPPKVVLVPPIFTRGFKDLDRFAQSSYDYFGAKRPLHHLLNDYLDQKGLVKGLLLLSPPEEQRINVLASVGPGEASMCLRYQPLGVLQPHTFLDLNTDSEHASDVALRASLLDVKSGLGMFASIPLAPQLSQKSAQLGLRFSSPTLSAGVIAQPTSSSISSSWLAIRAQDILFAMQLRLDQSALATSKTPFPNSSTWLSAVQSPATRGWVQDRASMLIAYQPRFAGAAGQGQFFASLESVEGRSIIISFFQHLAFSRQVINPLETKDVVGITNYTDLGVQVVIPTAASPAMGKSEEGSPKGLGADGPTNDVVPSVNIAASWQINKNWLTKVRAGSESASIAIAVKNWSKVGITAAANAVLTYKDQSMKYGLWFCVENFGALRYERGVSELSGRAVLQRHEANEVDLSNAEGTGTLVLRDSANSQGLAESVHAGAEYL